MSRSVARRHAPACMNTPKTAEPLPVICAPTAPVFFNGANGAVNFRGACALKPVQAHSPAPRRAREHRRRPAHAVAASLSGLSSSRMPSSCRAVNTSLVDKPRHGWNATRYNGFFIASGVSFSPTPFARCKPPRMQNGTSAPTVRPILLQFIRRKSKPPQAIQPNERRPPRRCCRRPYPPLREYTF